jgi:hypothetical protein
MENWRRVWRDGFAPVLPTSGLQRLATALRDDDWRLVQGSTTVPPDGNWRAKRTCPGAFCVWEEPMSCTKIRLLFGFVCDKAQLRLYRYKDADLHIGGLLNWIDNTPRAEMREQLLVEVNRELSRRAHGEPGLPVFNGVDDDEDRSEFTGSGIPALVGAAR